MFLSTPMTTYTKINLIGDTGDARFCKALSKESGCGPEISTKILSLLSTSDKVVLFIVFIMFKGHIVLEYRTLLMNEGNKNNIKPRLKKGTKTEPVAQLFVHGACVFLRLISSESKE